MTGLFFFLSSPPIFSLVFLNCTLWLSRESLEKGGREPPPLEYPQWVGEESLFVTEDLSKISGD
jgi:hypothetical protein